MMKKNIIKKRISNQNKINTRFTKKGLNMLLLTRKILEESKPRGIQRVQKVRNQNPKKVRRTKSQRRKRKKANQKKARARARAKIKTKRRKRRKGMFLQVAIQTLRYITNSIIL